MFNDFKLGDITQGFVNVAKNISKFGMDKGLLPTTSEMTTSTANRILGSYKEEVQKLISDTLKNGGDDMAKYWDDAFSRSKVGRNKQMQEAFKNFGQTFSITSSEDRILQNGLDLIREENLIDPEKVAKVNKYIKNKANGNKAIEDELNAKFGSDFNKTMYKNYSIGDYFRPTDANGNVNIELANIRKDAAIIGGTGLVGVSAINRYASGGTLTRNNRGERDIAGIPFI